MAKKKQTEKANANITEMKYAETLYVEKGLPAQAIAEELNRNIKTIYAWRDKMGWDTTKELFQASPTELKKILLSEAIRIAKGEKRLDEEGVEVKGIDADSLSKVMKAYDYMNQKLSPEIFKDAFVEFDYWMTTIDPKLAVEFTHYHKLFLQDKISKLQ